MRTPTPTPMGAPSGAGGGDLPATLMSLFRPGPGANVQEVLDNAQQVLEVLVKGEQHQAIQVSRTQPHHLQHAVVGGQ